MEKILPILEKYVEWIALGIGAVFLGLMAYAYLLQAPATVTLQDAEIAPSAVDPTIKESPDVRQLEAAMTNKGSGPPAPPLPPVATALQQTILAEVQAPRIAGVAPQQKEVKPIDLAATPPIPPKPTFVDNSGGWGLYQWTKAQAPVALPGLPGAAPAPGGVAPVAPFDPNAGMAAQMVQQELGWWTGKFEVSMAQLIEAFKAAKLDPANPESFETAFLRVELFRQEKQLDGSWGKETVVGPLPEYESLLKAMPLPAADAPAQKKAEYMLWASQNVAILVQPPFPTVVAGDPWYLPGTPSPAQMNQQPGVPNEGAPPPPFVPREGAPPPPVRPPARGVPAAAAPVRGQPYPFMLASGPGFTVDPDRGSYTPPGGVPSGVPGYISEGGNSGYNAGDPSGIPGASNPEGVFYPDQEWMAAAQAGLRDRMAAILAHDVTVQAGKTYRYRLRYHLRNPLFGSIEKGLKSGVADKLVISSEPSDWSKEYTVPARIEFWVNKVNERLGNPEDVEFEVFVAKPGLWKREVIKVAPGDQIAKGTDNSGWALVDVRKNRNNKYEIVLTDANGVLQERDLQNDIDDPKRHERAGVQPGVPGAVPEGGYIPYEGGGTPPVRQPPPPRGRGEGFTRDPG